MFFLQPCLHNLIWNSIFIAWNAHSVESHSILMCRIGVFCSSICSLIIYFYIFGCHSQFFITLLFIALKSTDISVHTIFKAFLCFSFSHIPVQRNREDLGFVINFLVLSSNIVILPLSSLGSARISYCLCIYTFDVSSAEFSFLKYFYYFSLSTFSFVSFFFIQSTSMISRYFKLSFFVQHSDDFVVV